MNTLKLPVTNEWLIDALIQCSVLLVTILLAERLFRKKSAAWRHSLLMAGALGIPLVALAAALMIHFPLPIRLR